MRRGWLIGGAVLVALGCGKDEDPVPAGDSASPAANVIVSGTWTVSGRGERTGCTDDLFNGEFEIAGLPIRVAQTPRAGNSDLLSLAEPVDAAGGRFSFSGSVSVDRVRFTAIEESTQFRMSFTFNGTALGDLITGSFTGSGPEDCDLEGNMEIVVTGRPVLNDGGPPDAGPGDAGPGDLGPGDRGPGDLGPGDTQMGDLAAGDTFPGDSNLPGADAAIGAGDGTPGGDDEISGGSGIGIKIDLPKKCTSAGTGAFAAALASVALLGRYRRRKRRK